MHALRLHGRPGCPTLPQAKTETTTSTTRRPAAAQGHEAQDQATQKGGVGGGFGDGCEGDAEVVYAEAVDGDSKSRIGTPAQPEFLTGGEGEAVNKRNEAAHAICRVVTIECRTRVEGCVG